MAKSFKVNKYLKFDIIGRREHGHCDVDKARRGRMDMFRGVDK